AAETELQSADEIEMVEEHGAPVELAVAVGVFEDQDAVVTGKNVFELFGRGFGTVRASPHSVPLSLRGGEGARRAGQGLVILRWFAMADRVSETFGNPETSAMVDGEGNRLLHVRFACKQRG